MTVPYDRIRSRVDCQNVACLLCDRVTVQQVVDHCHEHGWTRGILCVACNNRMARVDADLSRATAAELFHRDNCPACRREGHAGVARRMPLAARSTITLPSHRGAKSSAPSRAATPRAKPRAAQMQRANVAELVGACQKYAAENGIELGLLTRAQIKAAARGFGFSLSSDRIAPVRAALTEGCGI